MQDLLQDLERCEPSNLTQSKVYQINYTLYKYLYKSDSIKAPQYFFRPLAGQRKTADLKLNAAKIYTQCWEVRSLYGQTSAQATSNQAVQLSLF